MIKKRLLEFIKELIPLPEDEVLKLLEIPPDTNMGDFAFPCFKLSKKLKKSPVEIAKELVEKIKLKNNKNNDMKIIIKVELKGPYVNFFLNKKIFVEEAFKKIIFKKNNKVMVIDYSSPNIAKPFGIGHLRSTVIGSALKKVYEFGGWKSIGVNHLGDWGTQFGKMIVAYRKWPVDLSVDPVKKLYELYVKFHNEAENNPKLEELGRLEFKKLEEGDPENIKLWSEFRKLSLKEFNKLYDKMGVSFESFNGESFYNDKMDEIIKLLKDKNLLEKSEGAQVVMLKDENIETPAIIIKSDGATTYITRDIAAFKYRVEHYGANRLLYEVGSEQKLHFRQLFAITKKLGFYKEAFHISHGLYRFKEGKMSTRKGKTIFIEEVFEQAKERVLKTIEEKNPRLENKEKIAEDIGIGAIIFNDIKNDRNKDILFDWDEILDFEGESGPYLMYTYARLKSIIRKNKLENKIKNKVKNNLKNKLGKKLNIELLNNNEEITIAKQLIKFKEIINQVIENNKPHILARYVLDLAQLTNNYYQKYKIIQEDKILEITRIEFIRLISDRIKEVLSLLGLKAPEKM